MPAIAGVTHVPTATKRTRRCATPRKWNRRRAGSVGCRTTFGGGCGAVHRRTEARTGVCRSMSAPFRSWLAQRSPGSCARRTRRLRGGETVAAFGRRCTVLVRTGWWPIKRCGQFWWCRPTVRSEWHYSSECRTDPGPSSKGLAFEHRPLDHRCRRSLFKNRLKSWFPYVPEKIEKKTIRQNQKWRYRRNQCGSQPEVTWTQCGERAKCQGKK